MHKAIAVLATGGLVRRMVCATGYQDSDKVAAYSAVVQLRVAGFMDTLFSASWMSALKDKWNNEPQVLEPLRKAGFTANIAYGFKDEPQPRGVLVIVNGTVVSAGSYANEPLDWDLRAKPDSWKLWMEKGFGLKRLGPAVASRTLEFAAGNYRQMIRNPSLSHPFLHHFNLMSEIKTEF